MAKKRTSVVDRWKDGWFTSLPPHAKLVYDYLADNCDEAGFIEYTKNIWVAQLNMSIPEINVALLRLQDKLCSAKPSNKLWVKGHLFWQGYLPLNVENDDHKWIVNRLEANLEKFKNPPEMVKIIEQAYEAKKGKKKDDPKGKRQPFIPPKYESFKEEYLRLKPQATEKQIRETFTLLSSSGWVYGASKTQTTNWKMRLEFVLLKQDEKNNKTGAGRMGNVIDLANDLKQPIE